MYCPTASSDPLWGKCTESVCNVSLAPTLRRHFQQKYYQHEKAEPQLLLLKARAFIRYTYCPASSVPLQKM